MDRLLVKEKILIISPHADDETFGCGGTILKALDQGDEVYWVTVCHEDRLKTQARDVAKAYPMTKAYHLIFPDAKLNSGHILEIIIKLHAIIKRINPTVLFMPNQRDYHTDHEVVARACVTFTKSFRFPEIRRILRYEIIPGPNSFEPNYYVDITGFMKRKLDILKIYDTEFGLSSFARNPTTIRAMATMRGVEAGTEYAEAFELVKEIRK